MSDARSGGNDPSMDDILASIRKIISDDEARAQVGGRSGGPDSGSEAGQSTSAPPDQADDSHSVTPISAESRAAGAAKRDDVLLLTDLVDEPKSGAAAAPRPAPVPQPEPVPRLTPVPTPRIDPVSAADMPQPTIEPTPPADQSLVGASVAGAASSAFDRLSQAVHDSVPPPAAPDPGPIMAGGKTLEDVVKEMLRPMLKEWLDRNLPPMVERFVEREIVRLTRR